MLAILSPAKSLDFKSPLPDLSVSRPRFEAESARLAKALSNKTKAQLKQIMPVSDRLIDLNYGRYRDFEDQEERPAIYAYNGDVYTGFEAGSLESEAISFAQDHLRILSGLYGLLRPLDEIRPHRLEMGTRWAPRRKKLTDYWDDGIAETLAEDARAVEAKAIVNLASDEYWASVAPYADALPAPVIKVDFRQEGPDGPRFVSFEAKRARGMMARFICENHLTDPAALRDFDSDGYRFVGEDEDGGTLRFVRA